jgi:hypothetical protein
MHPRALVSRTPALALATIIVAATPAAAQASYESPAGTVEVLGLRRWTLAMLRDSIKRYVPGQDLHDAACMVTLRDSLHFAEASVNHWLGFTPSAPERSFLSIKAVEPQDKARVKWDTRQRDEYSGLLPDYAGVILPITDSTGAVWTGRFARWFQYYTWDSVAQSNALARAPEGSAADAHRVWTLVEQHQSDADRQRALRLLRVDGFWVNRYVAASVLVNFGAQDSTWYALVRALRDPHENVRESAQATLRQLLSHKVDWKPVAPDLRLLLGGTNLPAIETVFQMLDRTEVSPALASTLLRGNADWVLDHLASRAPQASMLAHKLLVRLNNGVDLGSTRTAWKKWAASL